MLEFAGQPQRHNMSLVLVKEAFRETIPEPETQIQEPLACSTAAGKVEMEETSATTNNATKIAITPNGHLELVKTCFTQELCKFCSGLCLLVHSKVGFNMGRGIPAVFP